jgi:hypothetical protein
MPNLDSNPVNYDPINDKDSQIFDRAAKYKIFGRVSGLFLIAPYLFMSFTGNDIGPDVLWNTGIIAIVGAGILAFGVEGLQVISDTIVKIKK